MTPSLGILINQVCLGGKLGLILPPPVLFPLAQPATYYPDIFLFEYNFLILYIALNICFYIIYWKDWAEQGICIGHSDDANTNIDNL